MGINVFFAYISGMALSFTVHGYMARGQNQVSATWLQEMSFKARLFLLYVKKLPWKSFGILVASAHNKKIDKK